MSSTSCSVWAGETTKICWSYFDRLQSPLVIMLSMNNIARGGFIECLFTKNRLMPGERLGNPVLEFGFLVPYAMFLTSKQKLDLLRLAHSSLELSFFLLPADLTRLSNCPQATSVVSLERIFRGWVPGKGKTFSV